MKRSNYFLDKLGVKELVAKLLAKIPTKTSQLENDSGYITEEQAGAVTGVKGNAETSYRKGNVNLTPADIGVEDGAQVNVQSDWDETDEDSDAYIQNKPTIPSVNNATLTIQKNGSTVQTFTANASSNKTANITVPTKTSDITDDSIFPYWQRVTDFDDAVNVGMYSALSTATNSPPGASSHYGISVFRGNSDTLPSDYLFQLAWEIYGNGTAFIRKSISLSNTRTWSAWKQVSNVQSDWSVTDTTSDAYILNKPTKTSDFTNDSDFVSDASYVHTDNNFTTALKTKLGGLVETEHYRLGGNATVTFNISSSGYAAGILAYRYSASRTGAWFLVEQYSANVTVIGTAGSITVTKVSGREFTVSNSSASGVTLIAIGGKFAS